MIQKFKRHMVLIAASLMMLAPGLVPGIASRVVAADAIQDSLCGGINAAANGTSTTTTTGCSGGTSNTDNTLTSIAKTIVNIFSIVVGATAVIMIIYGGFRYITSGGDSNKVGSAKNALIYAIVGLIIVALAQVIVHFVLNEAQSNTSTLNSN